MAQMNPFEQNRLAALQDCKRLKKLAFVLEENLNSEDSNKVEATILMVYSLTKTLHKTMKEGIKEF